MKINSAKKAEMRNEHFVKYNELAQNLGIESLKTIVLQIAAKEKIIESLQTDKHLNNIPLRFWDRKHNQVFKLALSYMKANKVKLGWSLSQTVCLLKHIAIYYIAEKLAELSFGLQMESIEQMRKRTEAT